MPIIKQVNQTGYKLETTLNTQIALVAADFANWVECDLIQPKVDTEEYTITGTIGTAGLASGKQWGELPTFKEYVSTVAGGKYSAILQAAGGVIVTGTPNVLGFGGSQYTGAGYTGVTSGAISIKSLSWEQFDGLKKRSLFASRPTKLSIKGENGKPVTLEGSFIGKYSEVAGTPPMTGVPGSVAPVKALGSALTIGGTALAWKDIEIDLGVKTVEYSDASVATGIDHWEVTNISPKITVTIQTPPIATFDYLTSLKGDTVADLVWTTTMGSWKAKVQISSGDEVYADDLGNTKLVLTCVYDSAKTNRLRLEY